MCLISTQMYLMQYGYLPMTESSDPIERFRSSDEVHEAVRRLQNMAGLPPTGVFDVKTKELLTKPRCGVRDSEQSTSTNSAAAPENYEVGSSTWPKTDLKYR